MKLIRFGAPGREKPGILAADGSRHDVSGFTEDYDEAFFAHGGLERLAEWVGRNEKTIPLADAGARLGPPVPRPSKIVCIGLNFRDHAAETGATVWIGYVDSDGSTHDRVVDPRRVEGGRLEAFDHRSDDVRSFAVHRISSVRPLDPAGGGSTLDA